ncbi:MAG: hypothetical protein H6696_06085 [Deferribacteres bacterium]|nr:hypothetical protein [candidate division KSB1 bacterium]MCB9501487.1 hypothetical protein [Deferribacteres bacterium]
MADKLENFDLIKVFFEQQKQLWGESNLFIGMDNSLFESHDDTSGISKSGRAGYVNDIPVLETKEPRSKRVLKFVPDASKQSMMRGFSDRLLTYNSNSLLGVGNLETKVVFVTDMATQENYIHQKIYSKKVGEVFLRMLKKMSFDINNIYLTPVYKFFIANPSDDDAKLSRNILKEQLKIIAPRYLFCLGESVSQIVHENNLSIRDMRGRVHTFQEIKTFVTHCPSRLIEEKSLFWEVYEDMKLFRKVYDQDFGDKPAMQ